MLPHISVKQVIGLYERQPFASSPHSQIYGLRDGGARVFKFHGTEHELEMMVLAGDCSVRPLERVIRDYPIYNGTYPLNGFTMMRETPLSQAATDPNKRSMLMDEMISCVLALHARGIIHGDVKPSNMLFCADGKVRLTDFAEARLLNEDLDLWEGTLTVNYMSPNRCQTWPASPDHPPVAEDDMYALGLSIWELYTGRTPYDMYDGDEDGIRQAIKQGEIVDVDEVVDETVRAIIHGYLRYGGVRV